GTTTIDIRDIRFPDIVTDVERTFRSVAQDKGLAFATRIDSELPERLETDPTRLMQILKNLLSNAFKFTSEGAVTLSITKGMHQDFTGALVPCAEFAVTDTGIGIPPDKHNVVFEAFQQADMSTARKFGGTGLGLAISREIAGLLGGEITLQSEPGAGSTFTFWHPLAHRARQPVQLTDEPLPVPALVAAVAKRPTLQPLASQVSPHPEITDDRMAIKASDRVALIIEDDVVFARILLGLSRDRGFKGIVATSGEEGLALARQFLPDAVTLDIRLPDMDGWALLDLLKRDANTRSIPVHVISGEEQWQRALDSGAVAHLLKPVSEEQLTEAFDNLLGFADQRTRNVLVIEDDVTQLSAMANLIGSGEVSVTAVSSGADALAALDQTHFDCVIVDLGLPDIDGMELIRRIKGHPLHPRLPVVVYTGRELEPAEENMLRQFSESIIVKDALSPERLIDETSYFLNQVEARLPEGKRIAPTIRTLPALEDKKVLLVDDDVRNIYALKSVLEECKMQVIAAESGQQCLDLLRSDPQVDIVLMDIMMPEMDGYETIRRVRADHRFKALPIIALTAKAMKGDREACLAAGASEYISKPVDIDQLISLIRVWLSVSA
ncbi:MAG: response regulator, partial [Candidatus Eremiobacteraeota bacterium]|nr:response regulator [Candidatus Eremiobacteraeota bacterium]